MVLSFRSSAGSWLGVRAHPRATNLRSVIRGGKLCISGGGSLWVGKLAVLLRVHHSRQVASCVRDLPQLGCGEMSVSVSPRVLHVNKNGCSTNKIGQFIKSKHGVGYTRCVPEQNRVVRREHFLGAVIGAVLRTRTPQKRFGVLRVH